MESWIEKQLKNKLAQRLYSTGAFQHPKCVPSTVSAVTFSNWSAWVSKCQAVLSLLTASCVHRFIAADKKHTRTHTRVAAIGEVTGKKTKFSSELSERARGQDCARERTQSHRWEQGSDSSSQLWQRSQQRENTTSRTREKVENSENITRTHPRQGCERESERVSG